ncbi:hypothetical protein [Patiriisocius sp. Uisw_017]|jgi:hypothetical protein|uniref:hypothetical protein n=1 Tax=Patiriisocius sp. Uisw_017 TaxID=3230968 RepID=UPI0039ED6300
MREKLHFEFGEVSVYKDYVIVVMKEGITVAPKYNDDLIKISEAYFKNRKFGYITHRKHSYSVDPQIYFKTSKIKNLVAFAIVANENPITKTSDLEKKFLKQPLKVFLELENAVNWVQELVKDEILKTSNHHQF